MPVHLDDDVENPFPGALFDADLVQRPAGGDHGAVVLDGHLDRHPGRHPVPLVDDGIQRLVHLVEVDLGQESDPAEVDARGPAR